MNCIRLAVGINKLGGGIIFLLFGNTLSDNRKIYAKKAFTMAFCKALTKYLRLLEGVSTKLLSQCIDKIGT